MRDGYELVFDDEPPPPSILPNNRSAREAPDFVWSELKRLEGLGCIMKVDKRLTVVNPMSVVLSGKLRLALDGSCNLNPYCECTTLLLQRSPVC